MLSLAQYLGCWGRTPPDTTEFGSGTGISGGASEPQVPVAWYEHERPLSTNRS